MPLNKTVAHVCVGACVRISVCAPALRAVQRGRGKLQSRAVTGFHRCLFRAGEPGWEVAARQAPAAPDSRQLRLPDSLCQLLQGRAPRARCHPRGAAPPAAAGEHLAAPQGAAPPAAAAVCFPAGRPAGESHAAFLLVGADRAEPRVRCVGPRTGLRADGVSRR